MNLNCNTSVLENNLLIPDKPSSFSIKAIGISPIWKVVKPVFAESAFAAALNLGVVTFFAAPLSIPLLTATLATSLASGCLLALRDTVQSEKKISQETTIQLKSTQLFARGSILNTIGLSGPNIVIHENGHYWAARLLFKDSKPKIWIDPFKGGSTSYVASTRLTSLGRWFGKANSMLITAAAGLAASTLFVCGELALAHKIRKSHPEVSQCMNLHAISHIFNEVIYGLMAFVASKKDLGHDLVRLWSTGGIHPLIPICSMIALPLIEFCAFRIIQR